MRSFLDAPRVWYFIFCPNWKHSLWYRLIFGAFTSRSMRHVIAIHYDKSVRRWVMVDPSQSGTLFCYLQPGEERTIFRYEVSKSSFTLRYVVKGRSVRRLFGPLTSYNCVTVMRQISRLPGWPTMRALKNDLIKAGAELV
jgi:hypothetical protein